MVDDASVLVGKGSKAEDICDRLAAIVGDDVGSQLLSVGGVRIHWLDWGCKLDWRCNVWYRVKARTGHIDGRHVAAWFGLSAPYAVVWMLHVAFGCVCAGVEILQYQHFGHDGASFEESFVDTLEQRGYFGA